MKYRSDSQIVNDIETRSKGCTICGIRKDFRKFHKDAGRVDGRKSECKHCANEKLKIRRSEEDYKKPDSEMNRAKALKRNYGITVRDYDKILESQAFRCAICGTSRPKGRGRFHVDHCHSTGRVRGLLCHSCNTGIGSLDDDPTLLRIAADYLEECKINNSKEV